METTRSTYLSPAETAKLVRKALKAEFPDVKFSVKCRNGGSSINVRWTDGPLTPQVQAVTSLYTGATFDGMTDMKSYNDSILVDEHGQPRLVHFGADFIFANREVGKAREALYRREVERFVGRKIEDAELLEVHVTTQSGMEGQLIKGAGQYGKDSIMALVRQMGLIRPWHGTSCPGTPEILPDVYCIGCGRYEGTHRAPHKH